MQEQRHLLTICRNILGPPHDQRCCQQHHFVRRNVRMHPVCARPRGKVVGPGFAWLQHWHRHVWDTVLSVVRDLPVPMNDRRIG